MDVDRARVLSDIFQKSGIPLDPERAALLLRYLELIEENNEDRDLTRIVRFDDMVVKHLVDSVIVATLARIPSPVVDIGSGAGLPGIPLAIMDPSLEVVLAEPRRGRVAFLEKAVADLGLSNASVYPHLVTEKSFFAAAGTITRALEPAADTLARVRHFLDIGGRALFMKGPAAAEELASLPPEVSSDFELELDREYRLPGTEYDRRLIVFRKITEGVRKTFRIMKDPRETVGAAIVSGDNRRFRELEKIATSRGVKKTGSVIVSGRKVIAELVSKGDIRASALVIFDGYAENDPALLAAVDGFASRGELVILKKGLFNRLNEAHTDGPLLVVEAPDVPEWDGAAPPGCTVLLPFQDPVNAGSAIRSAVAFGASKIVILREAANPFHPRCLRASAGAAFTAPLFTGPSIDDGEFFRARIGAPVIALDSGGEPLDRFEFPERFVLAPGLEGPGLPDFLRGRAVSVPISGGVESLNAATALSIVLYEWRRRAQSPSNWQSANRG